MNGATAFTYGSETTPRKPRLLLAEDEPATRNFLHEILRPEYEVEAVMDGHQAWAAAQCKLPDLVLSDVMMPGLDGIGLTRRLRAEAATATVLIVLLTAVNNQEQILQGLGAGVDDFLLKPFRPLELLARLRTHCNLIELRREATERQRAKDRPSTSRHPRAAWHTPAREQVRLRHLETELLTIQEQERTQVGRDLHDGVCQHLTGIRLLVNTLAGEFGALDPAGRLQRQIGEIEQSLVNATLEARNLAYELTPIVVGLENQPFRPVLEELAQRAAAYLGVECVVRCPEDVCWPSRVATHLYRIAQEAINNAHRHGNARRVEVRLSRRARRWRLLIIDDGSGLRDGEADTFGIGLRTMTYRAAMIDGTLMVRRAYGDDARPGTLVCCSFTGNLAAV